MTAPACIAFRAVAPELALGIAVGDARAAALDHVAGCASCRRELDGLTRTVDAVMVGAPVAEPPSGFEIRVLAGLDLAGRTPSHPVDGGTTPPVTERGRRRGQGDRPGHRDRPAHGGRRPRRWLVAAGVVAVLAGALVGLAYWQGDGGPPAPDTVAVGTPHASAGLVQTSDGSVVGRVSMDATYGADRSAGGSELVVTLDAGTPVGTYRVECDYESGPPYIAGEIAVGPAGIAHWSTTVSVPTYDLRRVRLVSTTGTPNLEAEITA